MLFKVLQVLIMLKFEILLSLNYNLKILNLQLKVSKFIDSVKRFSICDNISFSVNRKIKIESENRTKYEFLFNLKGRNNNQ